jgi:serine/threonine protein kinase
MATPVAPPVAKRKVDPASYDFLAPPQEADELGRLGPYRVLKVLGAGGMGIVFEAEDLQLKRKVALKVMPPARAVSETARKRFLREAQATAAIEHDHIVTIHQVGEDRGLPYLAMQLLKGEPLHERLEREPRLPVAEVLRLGREIARGLAAAHDRGLIHRDIKPANIWLENLPGERGGAAPRVRVKILDFGLARALVDDAQVTQTGVLVGTPAYMAPEQTRDQPIDPRCDLFSLGTLLYRVSTGRQPFLAGDTIATLMAVATSQPPPPHHVNPDLPPALSELIRRLLAKDPNDRPASARAVAEAIEAIEALPHPEPLAMPATDEFATLTLSAVRPTRREARGPRPRFWALAAGGLGLVALVSLLIATGLFQAPPKKTNATPRPQPRSDPEPGAGSAPEVKANTPAADPGRADRQAAEWVLKLGGIVEVTPLEGGPVLEFTRPAALPPRSFWVHRVRLVENKQVTDAGLENLKGLTRLQSLWLPETRITDAGLGHVRGLKSLQGLNLVQTSVSDRGLEQLQGLKALESLYLDGTGVTDGGLKFLKDLTNLRELSLRWTRVSDTGLEQLQGFGLKELQSLRLKGTKVSEAGVQRFQAAFPRCQVQR